MTALLYKELRLSAHPTLYLFTLLGALVLVPSYPYGMVFFFGCLGIYFSVLNARENNDVFYTAVLPVSKTGLVYAKCLTAFLIQLCQMILSLPFAFFRIFLIPDGNSVGIEANAAYYGFGFLIYAVFNLLFFPEYYKTGYKLGKAFILAIIPVFLLILLMEALSHFPGMEWIDSVEREALRKQFLILFSGILFYIVSSLLTCRISAKRFLLVDL